jgi:hypothetical protein
MLKRFRLRNYPILAMLAIGTLPAFPAAAQEAVAREDELASPKLRMEWAEFKRQYDAKAIEVVDVRGKEAYEAGHIPRAHLVPLGEIEKLAPELIERLRSLKKPIVLYCA